MKRRSKKLRHNMVVGLLSISLLVPLVSMVILHLGFRKSAGCLFSKQIPARRGDIHDRLGSANILAGTRASRDVWVQRREVATNGNVCVVAAELSEALDKPVDELIMEMTSSARGRVRVKRYVDADVARMIEGMRLGGVHTEDAPSRLYPHSRLMCHVVGFVNHGGVGSAGVEQWFDSYLKGCPGLIEGRLDGHGYELYSDRRRYIPPVDGMDIYLTLDMNLQHAAEQALDRAIADHGAKAGWLVAQRVRSGEILALVSRPAYDLNDFRSARKAALLNRAIGQVYEPGSTFKVAVIAAALDAGVVTPETVIFCENGAWLYNKRVLHDHGRHGYLSVADIVKKSSNIGAAKIAIMLEPSVLHAYLRAFGIGKRLGIDLPGEEQGLLRPPSEWSNICATRIAMGHAVAVTPIQMLGVLSAIANNGLVMRPYVVSRIEDKTGTAIYGGAPKVLNRAVRRETAATMRRLLARVTEQGGTGTRARVDGFEVCGKTGTAQKPANGVYEDKYVASFVGFLPSESPEIAILVSLDEPQDSHYGGTVAGPVFSEVGSWAARYFDIRARGTELASASPGR